ncbi:MAG: hypothetical protein ABWY83_03675 [Actinomycetota bacterium]
MTPRPLTFHLYQVFPQVGTLAMSSSPPMAMIVTPFRDSTGAVKDW